MRKKLIKHHYSMETFVILAFVGFAILFAFLWWREKQWEKTPEGQAHVKKKAEEEAARIQALKDKYGKEFYLSSENGEMMIGMHKNLLYSFLEPDKVGNVTLSRDSKTEEWYFYKRDDMDQPQEGAEENEEYRMVLYIENDLLLKINYPD